MAIIKFAQVRHRSIKFLLAAYSVFILALLLLVQSTLVLGQTNRVQAIECPGGGEPACTASCVQGCSGSEFPEACVAGCPDACHRLCTQDPNGYCGDGVCQSPENHNNCPKPGGGDCTAPAPNPDPDPNPNPGGNPTQTCSLGGVWGYENGCLRIYSGSCQIQRFSKPDDRSTGGSCVTTANGEAVYVGGPGLYCPNAGAGTCAQIDIYGSGQGVCDCTSGNPPGNPPPVTPPPPGAQTPGIDVEKTAVNGAGPYTIGSLVPFRITITNSGQTTHSVVVFQDNYNVSYLDFVSIVGNRQQGANVDLTASANINEQTGQISIADLTAALGDLAPGQQIVITMNFIARAPIDRTCNNVYIRSGSTGPEDRDDACLGVNNISTDL